MKNLFFLATFAGLVLLPSCVITTSSGHDKAKIKYTSLPAEGKNIPVEAFNSVKASGVFNLFFHKGTAESVVIKGDYPSDFRITNDGTTLIIMDTTNNHNGEGEAKTNIYITYKELTNIELNSVGETKTMDTIKTHQFNFTSDGVGASYLMINADSVTAAENGVGTLNISGKANYASIDDNGVGALKATDFKVHILHASVNGVGAAKVYADSLIYLNVNGIGGLKYYGPAKVMEQTSGGIGKVEHGN